MLQVFSSVYHSVYLRVFGWFPSNGSAWAPNPSFNSDPAGTGCVLKQFPWVLRSR